MLKVFRPTDRIRLKVGTRDSKPCFKCKGGGVVEKELCEDCKGDGVIYEDLKVEASFLLAPMTTATKQALAGIKPPAGREEDVTLMSRVAYLNMRVAIKGAEGLEYTDGTPVELKFGVDPEFPQFGEILSVESLDLILNTQHSDKAMIACGQLAAGVPKFVVHPATGRILRDAEIEAAQGTAGKN